MLDALRFQRLIFKVVRGVFRSTGIGKIRVADSLLYGPIRKQCYRWFWKIAAPDVNTPLRVGDHQFFGIGRQRGASGGMGLLMDTYEQESTSLFKDLVRRNMVVVDIGAHIGYYTLLAADRVGPSGKVYAFEPEKTNYGWLMKNIEYNGYGNVTPVPKVVSDKSGSVELWLGGTSGTHSLYASGNPTESRWVESTTLDDFFEKEGWPDIDVMKIDAEGAEHLIFNGMQKLLERQPRLKIIFEFNLSLFEANRLNPAEFLRGLHTKGFTLYPITGKKPKALGSDEILDFCSRSRRDINLNLLCVKAANYEN